MNISNQTDLTIMQWIFFRHLWPFIKCNMFIPQSVMNDEMFGCTTVKLFHTLSVGAGIGLNFSMIPLHRGYVEI